MLECTRACLCGMLCFSLQALSYARYDSRARMRGRRRPNRPGYVYLIRSLLDCAEKNPAENQSVRVRCLALIAATIALGLPSGLASAGTMPIFQLTDLGGLAGGGARATGLNESGVAVGDSRAPMGMLHAYLSVPGARGVDLGTLVGPQGSSRATAINDGGVVVGTSSSGGGLTRAFVATSGSGMIDLGALVGGTWSEANAINNRGQIVGVGDTKDGVVHGFVADRPGSLRDLGTLQGGVSSRAFDINDSGKVVGFSQDAWGMRRAFVADGIRMSDLGTLAGGGDSVALGINNRDQVVGYATDASGNAMAFITGQNSGLLGLGALPFHRSSVALGINDAAWVVGRSTSSSGRSSAFLWTEGLGMLDLNSLLATPLIGWSLNEATAINQTGMIVGNGTFFGQSRSFLLTPLGGTGPPPSSFTTPEPTSLALIGCGGLVMVLVLARRRLQSRTN
jgi:probable HAF family extracellular repeat protein